MMRRMGLPAGPLRPGEVTPASRETVPAYAVSSSLFGAAILGTLWRDHGETKAWPAGLRFVSEDLHVPLWLIGAAFIGWGLCMWVAMKQEELLPYTLALGGFTGYLILLGIALAYSAVTGGATYLAPLPFWVIAYLCRVTLRSLQRGDQVVRP